MDDPEPRPQSQSTHAAARGAHPRGSRVSRLPSPETFLAAALRSIGDAVITADAQGRVTFLNHVAEQLTGWPLSDAVGRPSHEVFHIVNETTRRPVESPVRRVLDLGHMIGLANHTVLIARDGSECPIDDSGAPILDDAGVVVGVVLVFRGISERRRAERALQRQAQLLDLAHDSVLVLDLDNRVEYWNRGAQDLYGWSAEEAVGQLAYVLLRTRFPEPFDQIRLRLQQQGTWQGELIHTRRDGTECVVSSRWALQVDDDGAPLAVLEINRDVTEQKRAGEALSASEARYHSLYSAMREGMALHEVVRTPDGRASDYRILDANPAYEAITGLAREQAIGRLASDLYGTGEPPYLDIYAAVAATGEPALFETEFAPMQKSFRISVFAPAPGQFATVFEDITGRKRREEEIGELNSRLRRAMAETHHRVKNNLQTIAALVDMQAMRDQEAVPPSELERLGRHVRGLAAIHDLLTQDARASGNAEFISVRDALTTLKPLMDNLVGGRELHFRVEDVRLPVRQGTALAVLVNELVSNAVKHGAGAIELSVAVVADRASLEVRDHGPGFPTGFDAAAAANTGLELVASVGRWDLQGEVEFGNASEGGARVVVRFPVLP